MLWFLRTSETVFSSLSLNIPLVKFERTVVRLFFFFFLITLVFQLFKCTHMCLKFCKRNYMIGSKKLLCTKNISLFSWTVLGQG